MIETIWPHVIDGCLWMVVVTAVGSLRASWPLWQAARVKVQPMRRVW